MTAAAAAFAVVVVAATPSHPALAAPPAAAPASTAVPTAVPAPAAAPAPARAKVAAPTQMGGPVGPDGGALAAKLPPPRAVDDILRDNVNALGGAEAMGKHRSLHTKMSITFQGLGITGTAEHYAAAGDRALTTTSIPNLASTREGTDGKKAWSQDPINGLRLLGDVEAEQARIEAAWNAELRLKELFPSVEAKNEPGEGGAPYLECLTLTPQAGPAMIECFDPRSHLLVRQRGVRTSPQGNTPFLARVRDWRSVGDLKMPFVTEMQVGPLSFVGTITSAELDVPVDASLFAVPEVPASASGGGAGGSSGTKSRSPKKPAAKPAAKPTAAKPAAAARPSGPKDGATPAGSTP